MLRLAILAIVFFASFTAWTQKCPSSPLKLHGDEAFDLQIFFDNTPAAATMLQLYARDKMVRSAISDQNGRIRFDPLPGGE